MPVVNGTCRQERVLRYSGGTTREHRFDLVRALPVVIPLSKTSISHPFSSFCAPDMPSPIQVVVPPKTYCSGSFVEGEVRLNFRHLQEDRLEQIWVILRGRAQW